MNMLVSASYLNTLST